MDLILQILTVTGLTWALTQEMLFAEFRAWLEKKRPSLNNPILRKLSYLPTCPFCAAQWIAAGVVLISGGSFLSIVPVGFLSVWGMAAMNAIHTKLYSMKLENTYREVEIKKLAHP